MIRDNIGRFTDKVLPKIKYWSKVTGVIILISLSVSAAVETYAYYKVASVPAEKVVIEKIVEVEKVGGVPAILLKIAQCESGGKQFKSDGRVVRGRENGSDIGKWQINEVIWNDKARELGFDIFTDKGNEQMATWLFNNYGSVPWVNSSKCWNK